MGNGGKKKKKPTVVISVSESEEEEDEEVISISESDSDDDDDDQEEEESDDEEEGGSDEDSEWSAEEEEETDLDSDTVKDEDLGSKNVVPLLLDDRARYDRVIQLLKGGGDLQSLKLEECKAYLRKHDLRLSGTKAVCIQRIQEHWRIKDGGENLYPRSSFTINCTGDVCKGDVVVFKQRVYEKFDKVTRSGKVLGKRTIAGRVVKESYGAAKQQHTFTVEVLWSKGVKKLPPLFPLLVKGRNLYRLKTFRQRWDNETERSKVLAEKHKRGATARQFRAMKKAHTANGAAKRQKHSQHTKRSPKRQRKQESHPAAKVDRKHVPTREEAFNFSNRDIGSTSTATMVPPLRHYATGMINQVHSYTNSTYQFDPRSMNHLPYNASIDRTDMQSNPSDISRIDRTDMQSNPSDISRMSHPKRVAFISSMNHLPYNASIDRTDMQSNPSDISRMSSHPNRGAFISSMNHLPYNASIDRTNMQSNPSDISRMSHPNRGAFNFSNHGIGSTSSATIMPPLRHYPTGMTNQLHFAYNPGYQFDHRSMNHVPYNANIDRALNSVPPGAERFRGVSYGSLHCSTPGCRDQRDANCVVFSCWRCCRRSSRRCHRHQ